MVAGLGRSDIRIIFVSVAIVVFAGALHFMEAPAITSFAAAGVALAGIAYLIGESTDQLGNHLGPAATGIIQSAVGNLPELFVCIFALKAGLIAVVQASLVGSILSNALLVLGLAFVAGGWRHGTLRFGGEAPRMIASLLMLAVASLVLPTFAHELHLPAGEHEQALAVVCALVLLLVYAISIRAMLAQGERTIPVEAHQRGDAWPLATAIAVLCGAGLGAGFVSEWFVAALEPAIKALGISQTFAGLVIVAIAGNAVEHAVGIQLAWRGKAELAVSVVLNSALQVAVALVPILILISFFVGGTPFTLAIPPLLAIAVGLAVLVVTIVTVDGEADMTDGAALCGLYVIIAALFWWG
jgi:Ca2+:H+ antiporter